MGENEREETRRTLILGPATMGPICTNKACKNPEAPVNKARSSSVEHPQRSHSPPGAPVAVGNAPRVLAQTLRSERWRLAVSRSCRCERCGERQRVRRPTSRTGRASTSLQRGAVRSKVWSATDSYIGCRRGRRGPRNECDCVSECAWPKVNEVVQVRGERGGRVVYEPGNNPRACVLVIVHLQHKVSCGCQWHQHQHQNHQSHHLSSSGSVDL